MVNKSEVLKAIADLKPEIVEKLVTEGVFAVLVCPKCGKITIRPISFEDYYNEREKLESHHLHICSCVSGGVYKVYFQCPHCEHEIELC